MNPFAALTRFKILDCDPSFHEAPTQMKRSRMFVLQLSMRIEINERTISEEGFDGMMGPYEYICLESYLWK